MLKRSFDFTLALFGLVLSSPILVPIIIAIWLQDFNTPFYIAQRVGKGGKLFKMVKLRSMVVNADKVGVDSTSAQDPRITRVGHIVRRYKLDELSQLWNVLKGDMSLVGPRPQVQRDVAIYTEIEKRLLSVKPGITDISSIVFADEGDILKDSQDPDLEYNQLIRPWKSRLGLLYIDHQTFFLDIQLIWLTALAILSREKALAGVQSILKKIGADEQIKRAASRQDELRPFPPPGALEIVTQR
jgi:lipopolysaccharide/colanic/teichoic acid biosynthesis glycosyltransferase